MLDKKFGRSPLRPNNALPTDTAGGAHMTGADTQGCLIRQFDTVWRLTRFHLDGLGTKECLWRPARAGLHVNRAADGRWYPDWPEHEGYSLGPPSIAWLTWHIGFWWSMVLDYSFGDAVLTRHEVTWPGSAEAVRDWINGLSSQWRTVLESIDPNELASEERTRWPFTSRPFGDVVAWANIELAKNAAEIGYVRFLYRVGKEQESA